MAVDAHEAHGQARALLTRQARLEQADHALALLARAQQNDFRLAVFDRQFVGWHQRHAAPGQKLRTEQADGRWRHAAARAFAAEGGNGQRVREEKARLLPHFRQQFVEVVRRGRARQRKDALVVMHAGQQAVVGIVDQFAFLALLDRLDGQAQLLLDLVVRAAVQVRHARVHVEHRADGIEKILARLVVVVDEGLRQFRLVALRAGHAHVLRILYAIEAVNTRFHGQPLQQVHQPARRDRG